MRRFKILVFLLLTAFYVQAQHASVSGKVVDAANNMALEYASVALFNSADSSLVSGVITNAEGRFNLTKLHAGDFYMQAQFIGYQTLVTQSFSVSEGQNLVFGNIALHVGSKMVDEISVTAQAAKVVNKLEKQTFRADQFQSAQGGSAVDVLKNMPSVAVNGQGEITMRGSGGFLVLINGKPVLTDAATALAQLPANMIQNIELITMPSAMYDPDGRTGIINITTKRGASDGYSLLINTQGGLPSTTDFNNERVAQRFGGDLVFNYRKGKWELSLGANYSRNDLAGFRDGDVWIEDPAKSILYRFPSKGERSFNKYYYAFRSSVTFTANKNNVFDLGLFTGKRYQERDANIFYRNSHSDLITGQTLLQSPYYNANKQIKQGTFSLANFDYTRIFANQSKLRFSALFEYDDLYGNTFNQNLTKPDGDMIQYVENPYKKPVEGYRLKLDYSTNIGIGKWESGYQFRSDSQDGTFDYLILPKELNQSAPDRFQGAALSENKINALYSQYAVSKEKLEYLFGLRYEYYERMVNLSFDPEIHRLSQSNLFPTASLLVELKPGLKVKAGASRRIQRSSNNQLNPIPEREHSETLEVGDPDLLPELVSLAELGLIRSFKKATISATAYYQQGKNPVQRVNSIYADTILNRVYTNVDKVKTAGLEMSIDWHPAKWWSVFVGGNVFRQKYEGQLSILGEAPIAVSNGDWVYSVNANSDFKFGSGLNLNANVSYLSAKPSAQGKDSRFLSPNLALKKSFMDNRLTASVQWQNIDLGMKQSNRQRITTWGENFYTTTNYIYETDMVFFNLSFNLNRKNGKAKLPESEFGEKEF